MIYIKNNDYKDKVKMTDGQTNGRTETGR